MYKYLKSDLDEDYGSMFDFTDSSWDIGEKASQMIQW
jgi:hypothetical protein